MAGTPINLPSSVAAGAYLAFVQGLFQKLSFLYRGPMGVFLDFHHFNLKSRDRGGRQQAVDRVMEGSSNHIEVSSMEVVLFFSILARSNFYFLPFVGERRFRSVVTKVPI